MGASDLLTKGDQSGSPRAIQKWVENSQRMNRFRAITILLNFETPTTIKKDTFSKKR